MTFVQLPHFGRVKGETTMKFKVILFKDEDNYIVASCPALPGCASQGKTREEALANIKEAIYGCVEARNRSLFFNKLSSTTC